MGNSKRSANESLRTGRKRGKAAKPGPIDDPGADSGAALSFETALEDLENSVARLEEGEMPLEEALEFFEAGVKLSRQCQSTLEQAERRVEILVANRESEEGAGRSVPFDSIEVDDSIEADDSIDVDDSIEADDSEIED